MSLTNETQQFFTWNHRHSKKTSSRHHLQFWCPFFSKTFLIFFLCLCHATRPPRLCHLNFSWLMENWTTRYSEELTCVSTIAVRASLFNFWMEFQLKMSTWNSMQLTFTCLWNTIHTTSTNFHKCYIKSPKFLSGNSKKAFLNSILQRFLQIFSKTL